MARPRGCSHENAEPDGAAENGSSSSFGSRADRGVHPRAGYYESSDGRERSSFWQRRGRRRALIADMPARAARRLTGGSSVRVGLSCVETSNARYTVRDNTQGDSKGFMTKKKRKTRFVVEIDGKFRKILSISKRSDGGLLIATHLEKLYDASSAPLVVKENLITE